ncbi:MAG TPA: hypothetical protein VG146_06360 [Verrucomicrobiae bacterium]|nr:hypothetical protein [Verrucomicrobiae bacterium]
MIILAYVDPGSGLLIWQAIIAAFLGLLFYLKKSRDWILGSFKKPSRPEKPSEAGPVDVQPPPVRR